MEVDNSTKLPLSRNCHAVWPEQFLPLTEFLDQPVSLAWHCAAANPGRFHVDHCLLLISNWIFRLGLLFLRVWSALVMSFAPVQKLHANR